MDTHQIEEAFEDLMSELQKVKNINESAEKYKSHVAKLTDQLELFYKSAKENNIKIKTITDDACLKLSKSSERINSSANSLAQIEKYIKTTETNICKSNSDLGNTLMGNIVSLYRNSESLNKQFKVFMDDTCLKLNESSEIINSLVGIKDHIRISEVNICKSNFELGNNLMKNIDSLSRKIERQNDQLKNFKRLNFILLIIVLVFVAISYIY
jgi:hypothetical protein